MEELTDTSYVFFLKEKHLNFESGSFEDLWSLRPESRTTVQLFGKTFETPRWHRTYEKDYKFTGMTEGQQDETPAKVKEFLTKCQEFISPKFNSVLVNWYNPEDYISMHADDEKEIDQSESIITYTICESDEKRKFVMQNKDTKEKHEFFLGNGDIFIMTGDCQKTHKHGLPRSKKYKSRRISITVRAIF